MSYERLREESERPAKTIRDHTALWEQFTPLADLDDPASAALSRFCEQKRISAEALASLGARLTVQGARYCLAFSGRDREGRVVAIKYRPLDGTSRESFAEKSSNWLYPIVGGRRDSLDWLIAEGETDAARLVGLTSEKAAVLCLPTGAGARFRPEWAALIPRGATVALAQDADEQGDRHAAKTAQLLGGQTIRLRPPEGYKDWCDWPGGTAEFLRLAQAAAAEARAEFGWTGLDAVSVKPIVWIDEPYLQAAAFHLFCGIKNAGKGTFLAYLTGRVTRGELGSRQHVLWIALGEDSYSIDVKPRILAADGLVEHVTVLELGERGFVLPRDAAELERKAAELGDVGLIILDPIGGAIGGGKSTNFDADVRPVLQSLNHVADVTEAMVFGVRHFSIKPERRRDGTLAAVLGSSDWVNVPRAVLALVHDDVDKQIRHLFVATGNRGKEDTPGLMVRIGGHVLPGHEHEVTKLYVLGESAKDPDELLAVKRPRKTSKTQAARTLILEVLRAADKLQMESDALDAEIAARTGLTAKTVRNVRSEMRAEGLIRSVPEKDDQGQVERWFVTLTGAGITHAEPPDPQTPSTHNLAGCGLDTPHHDWGVSGRGENPGTGNLGENPDFVTPSENGAVRLSALERAARFDAAYPPRKS